MDGYLGVGPLWTSSVVLPTGGVIVWWVSGWVLGWRVLMTFSRVASGWTGSLVDWISFEVEDFEDVQCRVSATNPNRHSRSGRPVELHQDGLGVGWITCGMEDFEDVQC